MMWFEIKWHFKYNWMLYVILLGILLASALFWYALGATATRPRPPVTVTVAATGTITSVRATGAWENWCKIELKFEDGTVLLTSYGFIRQYKIKQGRRYCIKDHSRQGRIAVPL